ncbi:MAG: para-aminobenzoate synthetase component 1, partial [Candidatus Omnitrophota bacterium]
YTMAQLLDLFKSKEGLFVLESSYYDPSRGRYSFLGFEPKEIISTTGAQSLDEARDKFRLYQRNFKTHLTPFYAGIAGFVGYEYGLYQEGVVEENESALPDVYFGFYETVITIDHFKNELIITSIASQEAVDCVRNAIERFKPQADDNYQVSTRRVESALRSNFSRESYIEAVEKVRGYIEKGDVYQVNLSQCFRLDIKDIVFDNVQLYKHLCCLSPAPFGGFIQARDFAIVSSSPERFLSLTDGVLQTRPMKGTASRGVTVESDECNKNNLIKSKKEQAELLMITDLLRNDLGRVCEYGSVHVKSARDIEAYATVYQTTSTIEGKLKQELDVFDVLSQCLPGGSVTGCPKIRATEIIREIEPTRRGIYTGVMGYINFSGDMDFNILIRSLFIDQQSIRFQVGGGIVYDSDPTREYEETLVKAQAIQQTIFDVCQLKGA